MTDEQYICNMLKPYNISTFGLTQKQLRQLRIAIVLFPELVIENESFRNDLKQLIIEKNAAANNNRCKGNLLNDLFSYGNINGNRIIKFNCYGDGEDDVTYVFYVDGTSNRICINNWNWGTSNTRFLPFKTTRSISLLDKNGKTMYVYEQKDITYKKLLPHNDDKPEILIDPKRSGMETTETVYLADDKYLKSTIDIKKSKKYYLGTIRKDFFGIYDNTLEVDENEYEQTLNSCLLLRK